MSLTSAQDALAQQKISKRLENIVIAADAPKHRWQLVKSWSIRRMRQGTTINRLQAKYRPVAVEAGVPRAKLLKAGVPFVLTVDLGLA